MGWPASLPDSTAAGILFLSRLPTFPKTTGWPSASGGRIRYFHPLGDPISKGLRKYSQVSVGTLFGEQRGLSLMKLVTSCFSDAFPRFRGHRRRGRRRKNKKFTADGHAIALSPIAVICAKRIRSAIPAFPHFPPRGLFHQSNSR